MKTDAAITALHDFRRMLRSRALQAHRLQYNKKMIYGRKVVGRSVSNWETPSRFGYAVANLKCDDWLPTCKIRSFRTQQLISVVDRPLRAQSGRIDSNAVPRPSDAKWRRNDRHVGAVRRRGHELAVVDGVDQLVVIVTVGRRSNDLELVDEVQRFRIGVGDNSWYEVRWTYTGYVPAV